MEGMDLLALILDAGLGVEIEGVIVMVSFYGNSDHNRGGGGLMGGGGSLETCQKWGTGVWYRSVLLQFFPVLRYGVHCHSCY